MLPLVDISSSESTSLTMTWYLERGPEILQSYASSKCKLTATGKRQQNMSLAKQKKQQQQQQQQKQRGNQ